MLSVIVLNVFTVSVMAPRGKKFLRSARAFLSACFYYDESSGHPGASTVRRMTLGITTLSITIKYDERDVQNTA
jgi:hypothetical protein